MSENAEDYAIQFDGCKKMGSFAPYGKKSTSFLDFHQIFRNEWVYHQGLTIKKNKVMYINLIHFRKRYKINQGCLELYDFRACNNLHFCSDSIYEIPVIGLRTLQKGFLSLVKDFCSCERKRVGSEKWESS